MNDRNASFASQGYIFSKKVNDTISLANTLFDSAVSSSGMTRVQNSDKALNATMWALEDMEMERAAQDIERNRKGNLTVSVVDSEGYTVPDATVTVNQTSHDFLFGVFDSVNEVGLDTFKKLKDIGVNYFTAGFYWIVSEPTPGGYAYDYLNNSVGVTKLLDIGYTVHVHALIYLMDIVMPAWAKGMNFTTLNTTIYQHVYNLVKPYADRIDIWNVVNEANGIGGNYGLSRAQMLQIIKTGVMAIRDADPTARILVNNPFNWMAEELSSSYMFEKQNTYEMSIPEYVDYLVSQGVDFDILGQQMYDGGYSSFFEEAGLGPGMPVSTYDFTYMSDIYDDLGSYGKKVQASEQAVAGTWNYTNPAWKNAGYWHDKWSPQVQADFLTYYYTLVFSKPNNEAVTWWDINDNFSFMQDGAFFDHQMKPKPLFYALRDFITKYSTNTNSLTDENGNTTFKAYGGNLNVTVEKGGVKVNRTVHVTERTNKSIVITLDGYTTQPDLNISASDVSFNTSSHSDTGLVTINVTAHNTGDRGAPGFVIRAIQGLPSSSLKISTDRDLPAIGLGKQTNAVYLWNATALSGIQNVTFSLDPGHFIDESDEGDNMITVPVMLDTLSWGSVRGRVIDASNGSAIVGANVCIENTADQAKTQFSTDALGNFSISRLDTGSYNITVVMPDFYNYSGTFEVVSAQASNIIVELERITNGTIIGTVTDGEGAPIEGANVAVQGTGINTTTDGSGRYILFNVREGNWNLQALALNHTTKVRPATVLGNRTLIVEFILNTTLGDVHGYITDNSTTKPLKNATVRFNELGIEATTSLDGGYSIKALAEGPYNVTVSCLGYVSKNVTVGVFGGKDTELSVALEPEILTGTLTGRVTNNATQVVIPGATIRILSDSRNVTTAADGNYTLTGLLAGKYEVEVSASEYKSAMFEIIVIAGKTTKWDIKLDRLPEIPVNGNLNVFVVDDDSGEPVEGANVEVLGEGLSGMTGADGRITFKNLSAGSYQIDVSANSYDKENLQVTIIKGKDTNVTVSLEKGDVDVYPMNYTLIVIAAIILLIIIGLLVFLLIRARNRKAQVKDLQSQEEPGPQTLAPPSSLPETDVGPSDEEFPVQGPIGPLKQPDIPRMPVPPEAKAPQETPTATEPTAELPAPALEPQNLIKTEMTDEDIDNLDLGLDDEADEGK